MQGLGALRRRGRSLVTILHLCELSLMHASKPYLDCNFVYRESSNFLDDVHVCSPLLLFTREYVLPRYREV